jgi:hypothetical protein
MENQEKSWWQFYFKKSFWSLLTIPLFIILLYQALYTSWETLRFLVQLGKYSWTTLIVFAIITFPLAILFTINYFSYLGIILIPTYLYEHPEWKRQKKFFGIGGLYLILLFIPWWCLLAFEWITIRLID